MPPPAPLDVNLSSRHFSEDEMDEMERRKRRLEYPNIQGWFTPSNWTVDPLTPAEETAWRKEAERKVPMREWMESGPGIARFDKPPVVIDYTTWLSEEDLLPDWRG